jgi:hypothetical protein
MTTPERETLFVAGQRSFAVRESRADAPRSTIVTVTMDGRCEWSFQEPGWRPLSFGASDEHAYLWSARELTALPGSEDEEPETVQVDEDLLYVFRLDGGWLMVCETSVRRVLDGRETDRVDLGDVIDQARWSRGSLQLLDSSGAQYRVRVDGAQLAVEAA